MKAIVFGSILITVCLTAVFIWVTNKAYSRKWENESDSTKGEF